MMLKKLIPAAALLALAGAAQAQLSPYGLVDLAYSKTASQGANSEWILGGNSTSRVGLNGSQALGSGLEAKFQLEAGFDKDGKSGVFFDRQAWAGVAGGFGEVRAGTQDSVPFQTMVRFDLNAWANVSSAQAAADLAVLDGIGKRSIQYISPAVSGFVVQVGHQLEYKGSKTTNSVGVTYTLDKLVVAATAESKSTDDGKTTSAVGASYDFGFAKVAGSLAPSTAVDGKGAMIGLVAPVAGFNVGLQYAKNRGTKATGTEVFVNKEIYKNTIAYADFLSAKTEGSRNNGYAIGVIYTF